MLKFLLYLVFLNSLNAFVFTKGEAFNTLNFLCEVQRLHRFQNVLIVQNKNTTIAQQFILEKNLQKAMNDQFQIDSDWTTKFVSGIMKKIQCPVLQLNEMAIFSLRRYFNDYVMSIVVFDGTFNDNLGLLKNFVLSLRHITFSKVLFLLNFGEENLDVLRQIFKFCWTHKMINVVALFVDYQETATFYSYTNFPNFEVEAKTLSFNATSFVEIYPNRLSNLKGYKLPFILGGSDPRIIVYRNSDGKKTIAGFSGHFLKAFAHKFNCELYEPLPTKLNSFAPAQELIEAVRNGTVDISAALTFPAIPFSGYSYPYEHMNWCVMMPVEPDIPDYEFYIIVFELTAFLITIGSLILISMLLNSALYQWGYSANLFDMFLHDNCLRGALGQPFTEVSRAPSIVRFIYLKICVLGILLTTSYNAYFATYVTSAPKEPPLTSFDDILKSDIKVYAWTPEFNELIGRVSEFKRYIPMFHLENSYQEYLRMRDSLNTKYGYIMPTTKWNIVEEQQKIFTSPLLKRNDDLCFYNNIPMCFPIHENSIFGHTLYQLILETAQSGLTNHWLKIGFIEMIIARKLSFADLSTKRSFKAMELEDLYYIWFGFAFMVSVASAVFIGELIIFNRKLILRKAQRIISCVVHNKKVLK